MKDNLANIPELNLQDTEHFYVVGTKNRDGILAGNYKVDIKKLSGGGGIDLTDREALKALWNALQDAITVVITEADVEEQVLGDFVSYKVLNTDGFPDGTWADEELSEFRPKVVGVFRNSADGTEEYQVSVTLDYDEREDGWSAQDNQSGCTISLSFQPDASWELSVASPRL